MRFQALVERLETRAHLKGRLVRKYRHLGLIVLVAIPLPGTGAWTGALVASLLDIKLADHNGGIVARIRTADNALRLRNIRPQQLDLPDDACLAALRRQPVARTG